MSESVEVSSAILYMYFTLLDCLTTSHVFEVPLADVLESTRSAGHVDVYL
jgi:hypothetical protein